MAFVLGATSDMFFRWRHCLSISTDTTAQKQLGTSKLSDNYLGAVQLPQNFLHASADRTLLLSFAVFVLPATHTWTRVHCVPHFRSQPDLYVRLHLSSAARTRPWRCVCRSSSALFVDAHSSSSGCTGLRCSLPLSNHRLQLFHSLREVCEFFLCPSWTNVPCQKHTYLEVQMH